ncbi:MAG: hypothetical protein ACRC1H_16355, partial [Caldilineaceae bacterium]
MSRHLLVKLWVIWLALLPVACTPIQAPAAALPPADLVAGQQLVMGDSATVAASPADVAMEWFKLMVQLARRTPGYTPPVAARTIGYAGITLYESLVAGMPGYQSLSGQLNGMPAMPAPPTGAQMEWSAVANGALAQLARLMFPTVTPIPQRDIARLERRLAAELAGRPPGLPPIDGAPVRRAIARAILPADMPDETRDAVMAQSAAYGRQVAEAVFAWSKSDGGHEGYLRNVDPTWQQPVGEGLWQPTSPDYAAALQPLWGENRTFALTSGAECPAPPPPSYSTERDSEFFLQALE